MRVIRLRVRQPLERDRLLHLQGLSFLRCRENKGDYKDKA